MQGKYFPLQGFLSGCDQDRVTLSFGDLEKLLGKPLPTSARTNPAWWANHAAGRSHTVWLKVGWRTKNLNIAQEEVDFVRATPPPARKGKSSLATLIQELSGTVTILDPDLTRPIDVRWEAQGDD